MTRAVVLAYGGALGLFVAVLVALVIQVSAGRDPAIGHGHVATAQVPKRALVRRVVRRVIVTDPGPAAPTAPAPAPAPVAVQRAPVAPAPPPPAPAPVVTRSS
jgi:hypothetical protein